VTPERAILLGLSTFALAPPASARRRLPAFGNPVGSNFPQGYFRVAKRGDTIRKDCLFNQSSA
jgi:hypothetical protein